MRVYYIGRQFHLHVAMIWGTRHRNWVWGEGKSHRQSTRRFLEQSKDVRSETNFLLLVTKTGHIRRDPQMGNETDRRGR